MMMAYSPVNSQKLFRRTRCTRLSEGVVTSTDMAKPLGTALERVYTSDFPPQASPHSTQLLFFILVMPLLQEMLPQIRSSLNL